jgi:hypothetical protein
LIVLITVLTQVEVVLATYSAYLSENEQILNAHDGYAFWQEIRWVASIVLVISCVIWLVCLQRLSTSGLKDVRSQLQDERVGIYLLIFTTCIGFSAVAYGGHLIDQSYQSILDTDAGGSFFNDLASMRTGAFLELLGSLMLIFGVTLICLYVWFLTQKAVSGHTSVVSS